MAGMNHTDTKGQIYNSLSGVKKKKIISVLRPALMTE